MKIENRIESLNDMLIKMSEVVLENLETSISLYYEFDESKLDLINDDLVDLHERLIEEMCLIILLKERPFAKDLRIVSGILKLVGDVERLGDHAEDLKEFTVKLGNAKRYKIPELDEAIKRSLEMVRNSIKAYVNKDSELAYTVIKEDDIVDNLYAKTIDNIIKHDKEYESEFSIYTTLIAKYIERIADHAVNISEWVIYILSGYYKDKQLM